MSAYQIGPFVLSAPRLYAALGLGVLILAAELLAWRRNRALAAGSGGGRPAPITAGGDEDPVPAPTGGDERPAPAPTGGAGDPSPPASATWAWSAAFAALLGARLGFVLENLGAFLDQPLAIVQFWQGGFSPWWGVAAGALVALGAVLLRRAPTSTVVLPAVLGLAAWLIVPGLLEPAQSQARGLPALSLERLEGGQLDLATLEGKPVVVNLWATWCPPCRRELPMLAAAARAHSDVHFVFADQGEARATVEAYLEQEQLLLDGVVLDGGGRLASAFDTVGLPTTLFFDAAGRHVNTHAGELSSVMLTNYLADLGRGGP